MPHENMTNTSDAYRSQCDVFITTHYDRLYKYALHLTRRNDTIARDVLHVVLERILEGRSQIDFSKSPFAYIQWLMRSHIASQKAHHQVQYRAEESLVYTPPCIQEYYQQRRQDMGLWGLSEQIPELLKVLNKEERSLIEGQLEGLTMTQMTTRLGRNLSKMRIHQIIVGARKKMKEKAEALLRDE